MRVGRVGEDPREENGSVEFKLKQDVKHSHDSVKTGPISIIFDAES